MTEKSKKRSSISFGTVLLIAAAAVNIPRWMGVFIPDTSSLGLWMHEGMLPILDAIAGALMGVTAAGAVMYIFHALGNMQRVTERTRRNKDGIEKTTVRHNERWYITAVLGVGILVISVYILQPYAESVMPGFIRSNISNVTLWSYLAVLASEMIIAAVALADKNAAGFAESRPANTQALAFSAAQGTSEQPEADQSSAKSTPKTGKSNKSAAFPAPVDALASWLDAHSADYKCHEQGCEYNALLEARQSGRASTWASIDQARISLTKTISGHAGRHKKQAPIPVEPSSIFGK